MSEQAEKHRKKQGPKKAHYLRGTLACQRCTQEWTVVDLNDERKVVQCPTCGEPNDIREAMKRAA